MKIARVLFQAVMAVTLIAGLFIGSAPGVVSAAALCVKVGGADSCYASIQAAIDAASTGDIINVYPGAYNETASGRYLYNSTGPYQFGLFFGVGKDGITIQGVDAGGTPITDYNNVVASITTNATNSFGYSGVFVEADNITITGFEFLNNTAGDNKTIEIIGDNFTLKHSVFSIVDQGGSVYINDWRYNDVTPDSYVESYTIEGNYFKYNTSIDISSGAGHTGVVANRKIINNVFDAQYNTGEIGEWATVSFNGYCPSVAWFVDPVGGAVITGNTFRNGTQYIRTRCIPDTTGFNWASYWNDNTYDKKVITGSNPPGTVTPYSYGDFTDVRRIGTSIQFGIDNAAAGDTISVGPGTYNEALTLNKPNITVVSTDGAAATIIDVPYGSLTTGVKVLGSMGVVTFNGFTVENFTEGGIIQGMAARVGTTFHVLNNVLLPYNGYLRNGIQVSGDGSTVIGNTVTSAYLTAEWSSTAIGVVNASNVLVQNNVVTGVGNYGISAYTWSVSSMSNIDILDNTITGIEFPLGVIAYNDGTISDVVLHHNNVSGYVGAIQAEAYHEAGYESYWGTLVENVDATANWWGSLTGPVDPIGVAVYDPWCGDEACTFTVTKNEGGEIVLPSTVTGSQVQTAIDNAPSGTTIVLPTGSLPSQTGGYLISNPGVTILLSDGAVVQNNTPCFVVNANNTTITTATFGGAKCVPTGGSNGIDVAAGLTNIVIDGIEIDGTGQTTGNGIHFAGAVTDVVIANTYIHDLGGDGVHFTSQPAGVLDIRGNLFRGNIGEGIDNTNGTSDIDATFNSWGDWAGPAGTNGDGITLHVDADPWTHVDLSMISSGSPWANQVVSGQPITYTIVSKMQNVMGADFKLAIPDGLYVSSSVLAAFDDETLVYDPVTDVLSYRSNQLSSPAVTGANVSLFTVTLSGTPGTYVLNLDETTDLFSMAASGSSNNIYAAAIGDGSVKVINLPTLASPDLAGYYLTGDAQTFHLNVTNTSGGTFTGSIFYDFTITGAVLTDVTSMACDFSGTSEPVVFTQDGANLIARAGGTGLSLDTTGASYTCTVTFATAKSYPITVNLVDSAPTPDFTLAALSNTAVVYTKPTIASSDMDGPYLVGIPQDFTLTITNGSSIPATTFELVFNFPEGTIVRYGAVDYPCTGGVCTIPVTLTAGVNTPTFSVTFNGAVSGDYSAALFDSGLDPDRQLAAYTQTGLIAYSNFSVTGSFSMQGRVTRAGIPVTLTAGVVTFGPFSANTVNLLSGNFSLFNVPVDTWTVTTSQPRYLNVTVDLGKTFDLTANKGMTALELKGGNANDDEIVNVTDASIIGGLYGTGTIADSADVNFDGKVNIFDLALVGGNFGLTSTTAYGSWTP
ncbi:MAG: hypothetical protein ACYC11_08785 [Bellilinea sp.]